MAPNDDGEEKKYREEAGEIVRAFLLILVLLGIVQAAACILFVQTLLFAGG